MKLIALSLLALGASLWGFSRGEEIRKRGRTLREVERFFRHLHFEIENFSRRQKEIYRNFSSPFLEKADFLLYLEEECASSPVQALHRGLTRFFQNFTPCIETEAIFQYTELFGLRSREEELEEGKKLCLFLEKENARRGAAEKGEIRLAQGLGVALGLCVFILLW